MGDVMAGSGRTANLMRRVDALMRRFDAHVGRKDVIHPDYGKVKHLAAVQEARREYIEAAKNNKGTYETGGREQKEAENNLNRIIEKALGGTK
jgi:hypothetical protein